MVFIDKEAEVYIKSVIKKFEADPQHQMYDYIIPPPIHSPYLPRVFIWAPLEHFDFTMKCFIHKNPLVGGGWTDNLTIDKHRNNPRLIFDVGSNILLIQRIYKCNTKPYRHDFKAATLKLLKRYPISLTPNHFPFKKYMRSMVSFDLIDHIFKDVIFGVGFSRIAEGFSAINYAHFQRIHGDIYESFYSNILYSVVSGDKIQNIFLDTYNDIKTLLENKHVMPALSLSIDYSYKAGMAYQGKGDHKDFLKFLVLLSETGQVVSWKVSKDDSLVSNMYSLLTEIKEKLNYSENVIQYIYTENCCEIREIIANLFPNVAIKRDLYQMIKSISSCLPEGGGIHEQIFVKELGFVFRQDSDRGDKRQLHTAQPQEILNNLISFVTNKQSYFDRMNAEKRKVVEERLELLKFHIVTGCLSEIPVSNGADSIEKFHHEFDHKKLVSKFYMYSPELAKSMFSVFCVSYNCRLKEKRHSCNSKLIPYLPRTFVSPFILPPLGSDNETYEDLCLLASANVLSEKVLNKLVCRIYYTCNTLKVIDDMICTVDMNADNYITFVTSTVNNKMLVDDEEFEARLDFTLRNNLVHFDLIKFDVIDDGDHLFRSILHQMNELIECIDSTHAFVEHVKYLELNDRVDEEGAIIKLRKLFVNEIETESRYQSFVTPSDLSNIQKFEKNGVYATNIGDLIVDAFSNILGVPFVVISCDGEKDISIHLPIKNQMVFTPLFLAYNVMGNGHYDGATCRTRKKVDKATVTVNHCQCRKDCKSPRCPCFKNKTPCTKKCYCKDCENEKEILVSNGCRCGERNTSKSRACFTEDNGRASKCPCLKSKSACSEKCTCKGCANIFGLCPDKLLPKAKAPRPKRDETTYKKPTRKELFEVAEGENVGEGDWSYEEMAAVISSIRLLMLAKLCVSAEAIQIIYSAVAESYPVLQMGMKLRKKSVDDVAIKILEMKLCGGAIANMDESMNTSQILTDVTDTQHDVTVTHSEILLTTQEDEEVIQVLNPASVLSQHESLTEVDTITNNGIATAEMNSDAAGIEFALDDSETKFFSAVKRPIEYGESVDSSETKKVCLDNDSHGTSQSLINNEKLSVNIACTNHVSITPTIFTVSSNKDNLKTEIETKCQDANEQIVDTAIDSIRHET